MNPDDYEIVSVEEAGIDISVPALSLVPDLEDEELPAEEALALEALAYEEALALYDVEDEEEEEQEQARPNRRVIRAAKRAGRLHGAGWTRKWRKGREAKPW